jgi:hypothetical protein
MHIDTLLSYLVVIARDRRYPIGLQLGMIAITGTNKASRSSENCKQRSRSGTEFQNNHRVEEKDV